MEIKKMSSLQKPIFKVIIAGTRDFNLYDWLCKNVNIYLDKIKNTHEIIIISGGCPTGADKLGEDYATEYGYTVKEFLAKWSIYGKSAGPRRNKQMVDNADALIAFWDGKSKGTKNIIELAKAKGIPVMVYRYMEII